MRSAKLKVRLLMIKQQGGFTLNEVLISIAIIAIGVVGFSLNTIGVIQGNHLSYTATFASNLAQDNIEEIKNQNSLTNGTVTEIATDSSGVVYTLTQSISNSTEPNLKNIHVRVSWTVYLIERKVIFKTLVYTG